MNSDWLQVWAKSLIENFSTLVMYRQFIWNETVFDIIHVHEKSYLPFVLGHTTPINFGSKGTKRKLEREYYNLTSIDQFVCEYLYICNKPNLLKYVCVWLAAEIVVYDIVASCTWNTLKVLTSPSSNQLVGELSQKQFVSCWGIMIL